MNVIRKLRLLQLMSQKQLADEVGASQQLVNAWEHGKCFPTVKYLSKVADALGVSVDDLVKEASNEKTA